MNGNELSVPTGLNLDPEWEYSIHPRVGLGGGQFLCRFPNGYGVSVIRGYGTYGAEQGLFELAVMVYHGEAIDDCSITYETPITNDVIGHLKINEVSDIMDQVADLPVNPQRRLP